MAFANALALCFYFVHAWELAPKHEKNEKRKMPIPMPIPGSDRRFFCLDLIPEIPHKSAST